MQGFGGGGVALLGADPGKRVAADAAGQRQPSVIGPDHAAIAAGKDQQRHQIGRRATHPLKCALKPSRSDGLLILSSWLGSLPGSHEPCAAMMTGARRILLLALRFDRDGLKLALALDADGAPWLEDFGAGRPRRVEQQPVQQVAPERAAEAALRRHACFGADVAAEEPDAPDFRPGLGCATHRRSPSRSSKARLVAEMNSPHTLRRGNSVVSMMATARPCRASVDRGGRAGRSGADDDRIIGHRSPAGHAGRQRHG